MNIDEILDQLIEDYKYYGSKNAGMIAKAKAQIDSYVEELIGEDEMEDPKGWNEGYDIAYDYEVCRRAGANNLRVKQREALRQQVKEDVNE